jgi:hypothetical protein
LNFIILIDMNRRFSYLYNLLYVNNLYLFLNHYIYQEIQYLNMILHRDILDIINFLKVIYLLKKNLYYCKNFYQSI